MREIKFRAWHKKYKKMYRVLHLHLPKYDFSDNTEIWATCEGFDIIEQKPINIQIQPKNCILLQHTGLTDKNGLEIYEGDIVKVTENDEFNKYDSNTGLGFVTFYFGIWYVTNKIENGLYDLDVSYEIEVIGNIYENPELLEVKNESI